MRTFVRVARRARAIAISHPHYYTTMVEWAHAFDCPILVPRGRPRVGDASRRRGRALVGRHPRALGRPDAAAARRALRGGQVLHWPEGDALLSGDIVQVLPGGRWVSFMYSYPMLIPLPAREVERIAAALEP